jgi:hypothetical protein
MARTRHRHWFVRADTVVSPDQGTQVTFISRFGHVVCFHVSEDGTVRAYSRAQFMFWCKAHGIELPG